VNVIYASLAHLLRMLEERRDRRDRPIPPRHGFVHAIDGSMKSLRIGDCAVRARTYARYLGPRHNVALRART